MSVAQLYVIVSEELVSGNTFPSFLHAKGRCGLNFTEQFSVTNALGEAGKETSFSLRTKRKGTWTEKETHENHRSVQLQCHALYRSHLLKAFYWPLKNYETFFSTSF